MNKFYTLTILTLLTLIQSFYFCNAQTIHQGDVYLESQAQVDSFGAIGYTHIEGYLRVGNYDLGNSGNPSDINSLSALIGLKSIDSSFILHDNILLTNLIGLDSLTHIGKSLQLRHNLMLQSLQGLDQLEQVSSLLINLCNSLVNLNGLSSFQGGDSTQLTIVENFQLESLDGIDQMTSISGIFIRNNDNLMDISGLENLTSTTWFSLYENESLLSLNGLQNLDSVWRFNIVDNMELRDFCAISEIYDNGYLNQFDINNFNITGNLYNPTFQNIIDNVCSLIPVGIESYSEMEPITCAPNPTQGVVNIKFGSSHNKMISITNLAGQTVLESVYTSASTYALNLDVPAGVYFIEVVSDLGQQQFKVVKL